MKKRKKEASKTEEKDYKLFKDLGYNISHVDDDRIEFYKDPYDILHFDKKDMCHC